uniref:RRM domain-containing protein n=1 Tax=Meloidogyne enterolobii TaxID=390850 RepID=A0A6V7WYW8_MELEN|nr:unnamed protein product [Meloidogyne enterolobii]
MLNPNWLNDAIANTKTRTSSLAVNGPAAYGPYLQESRLDIRRNSHNPPPPQQLLDTNNFPDLQQQQQRPSSAHSFPSLFPQQEQNDFQQQMISQQGQGQQGSQMQPLSSRKLFIGGLGQIDDNTLKQYYSQWGQVVDCIVIRDPTTRSSRGFGFVTYTTAEMADACIAALPHRINGKNVDAKRAVPKEKMNPIVKTEALPEFLSLELAPNCRLQLSGLNWEWHTLDTMRAHFEQFGPVEQLEMVAFPRGYGFLSFETQSAVDRCLAFGLEQIVNGHSVDIKLATPDSLNNFETLIQTNNQQQQNAATMTDDNCFDDDDVKQQQHSSSRPHSSASSSVFESDENFNNCWKKGGGTSEKKIINKEPLLLRNEEEIKKEEKNDKN